MSRTRTIVCLRLLLLTVFAFAASGGCVKKVKLETADPYVVNQSKIRDKVHVIAVTDVFLPDGVPDPESVLSRFSNPVDNAVQRGGFSVVRPSRYSRVWDAAVEKQDGLRDIFTGELVEERVIQASVETMQELKAGFEIDAVLLLQIEVVEAFYANKEAAWHGKRQTIREGGGRGSFFQGTPDGRVDALSLRARLYNKNTELLYENYGGIEVLSRIEEGRFVLVPRDEILTDPGIISNAVKLAVEPLGRR